MVAYKNISSTTKTFRGVTFHPGEVKEVSGYINHPSFVQVSSLPKEPPKASVKAPPRPVSATKEVEKQHKPSSEEEKEQEQDPNPTEQEVK